MTLGLIFAKFNGNAHPEAGLNTADRTFQPHGPIDGQARAKARADPKYIVGLNKHPSFADIACTGAQTSRTPFDLHDSLIAVARRSPTVRAASFRFSHVHGRGTLRVIKWRAKVEPSQRASAMKIRREELRCFRHRRRMFCSRHLRVGHMPQEHRLKPMLLGM